VYATIFEDRLETPFNFKLHLHSFIVVLSDWLGFQEVLSMQIVVYTNIPNETLCLHI